MIKYRLIILLLLVAASAMGQNRTKIQLVNSSGSELLPPVNGKRLVKFRNGVFRQDNTTLRADSVLLNNTDNIMDAYGHVNINQGDELYISISGIKRLQPVRLLLFKLLQPYGFNETIVDDVMASLDKHAGRMFESGTHQLVLDREQFVLSLKKEDVMNAIIIKADDHALHYGAYRLTLLHDDSALIVKDNPLAVSVDTELLVYPLTVRSWQQSDFFYPLGMSTRKKLSDFFINRKIPRHQKTEIPILVNGNGDIIWVGGYQLDNRYRVSNNTKKVTIFELFKL